jgi:hypothetical protein
VTGQHPASLDRLDLLQRRQRPLVIVVDETRAQARPRFTWGEVDRCQRVSHDQDFPVLQTNGHIPGGVTGRVDHARMARHLEDLFIRETRRHGDGRRPGHAIAYNVSHTYRSTGGFHSGNRGGLPPLRVAAARSS